MREVLRLPANTTSDAMLPMILDLLRQQSELARIALQVWASADNATAAMRPDVLWKSLAMGLTIEGFTVARGNQPHILSVCFTPQAASWG